MNGWYAEYITKLGTRGTHCKLKDKGKGNRVISSYKLQKLLLPKLLAACLHCWSVNLSPLRTLVFCKTLVLCRFKKLTWWKVIMKIITNCFSHPHRHRLRRPQQQHCNPCSSSPSSFHIQVKLAPVTLLLLLLLVVLNSARQRLLLIFPISKLHHLILTPVTSATWWKRIILICQMARTHCFNIIIPEIHCFLRTSIITMACWGCLLLVLLRPRRLHQLVVSTGPAFRPC